MWNTQPELRPWCFTHSSYLSVVPCSNLDLQLTSLSCRCTSKYRTPHYIHTKIFWCGSTRKTTRQSWHSQFWDEHRNNQSRIISGAWIDHTNHAGCLQYTSLEPCRLEHSAKPKAWTRGCDAQMSGRSWHYNRCSKDLWTAWRVDLFEHFNGSAKVKCQPGRCKIMTSVVGCPVY